MLFGRRIVGLVLAIPVILAVLVMRGVCFLLDHFRRFLAGGGLVMVLFLLLRLLHHFAAK